MCVAVAHALGHPDERLKQFEVACLLHDIGRAGLEPKLFGELWSWAKERGIPTRPAEWRAAHPRTPYGQESQAFIAKYRTQLIQEGFTLTPRVKDHIDMRLGFSRRLKKYLKPIKPAITGLGLTWAPWMERIMLFYYYPEKLETAPAWVHQLGEILVGCEQLEAYSNHRRGKDYYVRSEESFRAAFAYLKKLTSRKHISRKVFNTICQLTREGHFTTVLKKARGGSLTPKEQKYLTTVPI